MKYRLIIINIVLFCSFFSICSAYPNEKNGFRNLYWGESLQEVQADNDIYDIEYISYDKKYNTMEYIAKLKKPYIGELKVERNIYLEFWNNRLYRIKLMFFVEDNFWEKLMKSLEKDYGITDKTIKTMYIWNGEKTKIEISFGNRGGSIFFINPYLEKELAADEFIKDW